MKTKIENFLSELNTEIDVLNLIDIDSIDYDYPFESISDMIQENNVFNVDIIYYSNAIDYLSENDPSLRESLAIAYDMGFTVDSLNSEILASLLKTENVRNDFYQLEDEINTFFEELEEEEEEEEE